AARRRSDLRDRRARGLLGARQRDAAAPGQAEPARHRGVAARARQARPDHPAHLRARDPAVPPPRFPPERQPQRAPRSRVVRRARAIAAGGRMTERQQAVLRGAFIVGAIVDALAVIPMLVPSLARLMWGFDASGGPYRFAMGYAATLMGMWAVLL